MVYVEEFLYRGRDAANEKGLAPTFHVVLAHFTAGPDGKLQQLKTQPLTPAKALEAGYSLEAILGEIANSAVLAHDAQKDRADKAELDRDVARQDYAEMAAQLRKAQEDKQLAVRAAGDLALALDEAGKRESALVARVDELTKPSDKPSNPLLNKLTFGLAGN